MVTDSAIKDTVELDTITLNKGHAAMEFAGLAGELLLMNGAETSRVEDTIARICRGAEIEESEVVVFPTGIIINGVYNGERVTKVKRIHDREINMTVVSVVNDISRKFANGSLSLPESMDKIIELKTTSLRNQPFWSIMAAGAIASGAATILSGGTWSDFVPAMIATAMVRAIIGARSFDLAYVLKNYLAGLFAGLIGSIFVEFSFGQHLDKIVIGALIPMVPGVALTNAIRDFISGDLLSGTLRMVEAFLIAAALAGGVGFALTVYASYLRDLLI